MLELQTKTFIVSTDILPEICAAFKKPIVFYLKHKNDRRAFFTTFVILDFQKKELTYVTSYLPENIPLIERHPQSELFQIKLSNTNPHCTLQIEKDKSFLTFVETTPYFFKLNYQKNLMQVYTGDDFDLKPDEIVASFSPTVYKDEDDPAYFYFSSLVVSEETKNKNLYFYRALLDLSKIEKIHTQPAEVRDSPHVIRKIGASLFGSDFLTSRCKNLQTGEIFETNRSYMLYVYKALYKKYCEKNGITYSEQDFQANNRSASFNSFCFSKGKDFLEICKRNSEFSFSPLPGSIFTLNLKTNVRKDVATTFCAPAHFEIDNKTGDIYVSSHNFSNFGKIYFFGPAAIDHFQLKNGELTKLSTFSHPDGYRFTSHKVFSWEGRTYLCTFGQPNRLFFIDTENMRVLFYEDIEEDLLSQQTDIANFINYTPLEAFVIKTIEVSDDGQFIFFMSYDYIYFYSFPERKIVQKIRYTEGTSPDGEIVLADFNKQTTHVNYLF